MYKMVKKRKVKRITCFFMVMMFLSAAVMTDFQTSLAAEKNVTGISTLKKRYKKSVDEYDLSKNKDTIVIKNKGELSVSNITPKCNVEFSSSNTDILNVKKTNENTCEYRGKKVGNADINVKITKPGFLFMQDTTYLKCKVNVTPKAVSICFTKKKVKIALGYSKKLKLTTRPSISKEKAVFTSSNSDIVEVDQNGRITARFIGKATIKAKISNGRFAKCLVEVRLNTKGNKEK